MTLQAYKLTYANREEILFFLNAMAAMLFFNDSEALKIRRM